MTTLWEDFQILNLKEKNRKLTEDCDFYKNEIQYTHKKIKILEINNQGLQDKIQNQAKEINRLSKLSNKNWEKLREKFIQFCEKELKK